MASDWCDLRTRFFEALDRSPRPNQPVWREAWHVLATHPCYRSELAAIARRIVIQSRAPLDLADDVAHEALVLMARDLQRESLGGKRAGDVEGFRRWMDKVIALNCREALRTLRRIRGRESEIGQNGIVVELIPQLDLRLDLYGAVQKLKPVERTVVELHSIGFNLRQIAEQMGVPHQTVFSIWQRAIYRLRQTMKRGDWS